MRKVLFFFFWGIILVLCIFPPWQKVTAYSRTSNIRVEKALGYSPIWEVPHDADMVDYNRLLLQITPLLLFLIMLFCYDKLFKVDAIKTKKTRKPISNIRKQFIHNKRLKITYKWLFFSILLLSIISIGSLLDRLNWEHNQFLEYKEKHSSSLSKTSDKSNNFNPDFYLRNHSTEVTTSEQ